MGAESKGILKPSRFSAHVDEPAAHADEGDATPSATQTTHYKEFHSRVADVFANLGPGICGSGSTGGASDPTGSHQPPAEAVWMPANTTVTRRGARHDYSDDDDDEDEDGRIGRPKRNGNDDSSDDSRDDPSDEDDEEDRPTFDHTASNAEVSEVRRQRQKARWAEDLDCLESDEEGDDDQKKMAKLGRSVGRCSALNDEEEFRLLRHARDDGDESKRSRWIATARAGSTWRGYGGWSTATTTSSRRMTTRRRAGFTKVLASNEYERRILAREDKDAPDEDEDEDEDEDTPDEAAAGCVDEDTPESESERRRSIQSRGGVSGADLAGRTCPRIKGRRGSPGRRHPGASLGTIPCPRWTRPKFGGSRGRGGGRGRGRGVPDHVKTPTNTRATPSTNL